MAAPTAVVYNGKKRNAGKKKLRGKAKAAFLRRMSRGRNRAAAKNHRPRRNLSMFEDSRGYIHPIRGSKGYKKSKTTNRKYNGKKKKKKKPPAARRPQSSNPGVFTIMAQPRKRYSGKKKRNTAKANKRRNRRNGPKYNGRKNRKRNGGHHIHRNPVNVFAGKNIWDAIKVTAETLGGFLATNILPQTVASSYNSGATGYLMNFVVAVGGGFATGSLMKTEDGWAVLIGGLMAIANRISEDLMGTPVIDATTLSNLLSAGVAPAAAVAAATVSTNQVAASTGLPVSSTGVSGVSQARWQIGKKGMRGSYEAATFPVPQGQQFPGQPFPALPAAAPVASGKSVVSSTKTGTAGGSFAGSPFFA